MQKRCLTKITVKVMPLKRYIEIQKRTEKVWNEKSQVIFVLLHQVWWETTDPRQKVRKVSIECLVSGVYYTLCSIHLQPPCKRDSKFGNLKKNHCWVTPINNNNKRMLTWKPMKVSTTTTITTTRPESPWKCELPRPSPDLASPLTSYTLRLFLRKKVGILRSYDI